jgi:hypothetical protein
VPREREKIAADKKICEGEINIMGEHNCYGSDVQACIRKKAYELWEKDGRKSGREMEHWLMAEKTVHANIKKPQPKK